MQDADRHLRPKGGAFAGGRRADGGIGLGGGRRARRPRPFGNGDLRLIMLSLIAEAPSHGYELIKSVEERLGGGYSPSPGIIYPTLTLLEQLGYIAGSADGAKRLFAVTEAGLAHLADQADTLGKLAVRMAAFGSDAATGRMGPVTRALENLKLVLRQRTQQGELSDEQLAAIRMVLDGGADAIERI